MMIKQGLKTFKKPALLLSVSLGLWLGVSCQDDMLAERQPVITAGDEISFAVASDSAIAARSLASAPPVTHRQFLTTIGKDSLFLYTTIEENTDQPFKQSGESRAASNTTASLSSFYVDALYNGKEQFMNATKVSREDSLSSWTYSPLKYWPNNEGDYLDFYGYMDAPEDTTFAWTSGKKNEEFSYHLPAPSGESNDALGQTDLIFAQALNQTKQSINGRVVLNFYHALSAVLFKVGSLPSDISLTNLKITLKDVKSSGTCEISNANNALSFSWDTEKETASYSQVFSSDKDKAYANGNDLSTIDKETAFMMIPQTFTSSSEMLISFYVNDVKHEFSHPLIIDKLDDAGKPVKDENDNPIKYNSWNPNTKYTYTLSIEEFVRVRVDDEVNNNVKSDVVIQNTGLSNAWMRAAIVGYWVVENKDEDGNVTSEDIVSPWSPDDENAGEFIGLPGNNWSKETDGFYYYNQIVPPGAITPNALFGTYTLTAQPPMVGAKLKINIVVQAVDDKTLWNSSVESNE